MQWNRAFRPKKEPQPGVNEAFFIRSPLHDMERNT